MLNLKITKESISEILLGLRSGKAMGYDEIPNEFLRYGGKAMLSSLVDLFTALSDFEQIPSDWQNGIIKPMDFRPSNISAIDSLVILRVSILSLAIFFVWMLWTKSLT
jgi:hypothetical protein